MAKVTLYLRTLRAAALSGATTPDDETAFDGAVSGYVEYLAGKLAEYGHRLAENECDMSAHTYLVDADDYEDECSAHEEMGAVEPFWDWYNRAR